MLIQWPELPLAPTDLWCCLLWQHTIWPCTRRHGYYLHLALILRMHESIMQIYTTSTNTSPISRTTWVSRYLKGTSLDLNEARDDGVLGWQWHQLDHLQTICTSLQTYNHANTSSLNFLGQMLFLAPNQQCQSTEGIMYIRNVYVLTVAVCVDV